MPYDRKKFSPSWPSSTVPPLGPRHNESILDKYSFRQTRKNEEHKTSDEPIVGGRNLSDRVLRGGGRSLVGGRDFAENYKITISITEDDIEAERVTSIAPLADVKEHTVSSLSDENG